MHKLCTLSINTVKLDESVICVQAVKRFKKCSDIFNVTYVNENDTNKKWRFSSVLTTLYRLFMIETLFIDNI